MSELKSGYYFDFLCPKGHKNYSMQMIEFFSSISRLSVYTQKTYYDDVFKESIDVEFIEYSDYDYEKKSLKVRYNNIKLIHKCAKMIKKNKKNFNIVASFDTISLFFGSLFFSKKQNVFLIHHNNVDHLNNFFKRMMFKFYKRKFKHIVIEEFIKERLSEVAKINKQNIYCINHPMKINGENDYLVSEKITCSGLSNSNDEIFIQHIYEQENKKQLLKYYNIYVIFKSSSKLTDIDNIKFINGFISENEYNEYRKNSKFCILCYPKNFLYRTSGVLINTFAQRKIVLGSNNPIFNYYSKKYPSICKIINNYDELIISIKKSNELNDNEINNEFNDFINEHSKEKIMMQIKTMLYGGDENEFNLE